jgi:hypothetical protein
MTLSEAALLMGVSYGSKPKQAAKVLKRDMDNKDIPYIKRSRQRYIFDRDYFPDPSKTGPNGE